MILFTIAGGLLILWFIGLVLDVGGWYIHVLFMSAVILSVIQALRPFDTDTVDTTP